MVVVWLAAVLVATVEGGNWPSLGRDPQNSRCSSGSGPAAAPRASWSCNPWDLLNSGPEVTDRIAGPVIDDEGRILLFFLSSSHSLLGSIFFGLSTDIYMTSFYLLKYSAKGELVWNVTTGLSFLNHGGPVSIAVAQQGLVYVNDQSGTLFALQSATGKTLWQFDLQCFPGNFDLGPGESSGLQLLSDSSVFVTSMTNGSRVPEDLFSVVGFLIRPNGSLVWSSEITQTVYGLVTGVVSSDASLIATGTYDLSGMFGVSARSGVVEWTAGSALGTAGAILNDSAFFQDLGFSAFSVGSGRLLWKLNVTCTATPAVDLGRPRVAFIDLYYRLVVLNATSGSVDWVYNISDQNSPETFEGGSPLFDVHGNVYFGSWTQRAVFAFDSAGHMLWLYNTTHPVIASLSMSDDGSLVVLTTKSVLVLK